MLFFPFFLAIGFCLLNQKKIGFLFFFISLFTAFFSGVIEFIGILVICFGLSIAYWISIKKTQNKIIIFLAWASLLVWSVLLFLHILPGFNNLLVLQKVSAGALSAPFSLYFNWDKPLVFFALLLAYPKLLSLDKKPQPSIAILCFVFLMLLFPIGIFFESIKIEISLPSWWWQFVLGNFFLTCVAEEALFRGLIQQQISGKFNWQIGLVCASVLFGVAHITGGMALVIFATLAGFAYGAVYHFSGKLWCAVLAHFLFNFIHLIGFTYPYYLTI